MSGARVKALVWYGKPEGQDIRIGRCGQIAYSVSFQMGSWGYSRQGDVGHVVGYKGCIPFRSEADAMDGADLDHEARILSALDLTAPPTDEECLRNSRVRALVEALEALIQCTHDCEKELTEQLHKVDFQGESWPLCQARAALAALQKGMDDEENGEA